MTLTTPILNRQAAFDATREQAFVFQYESGNQAIRNKLTIFRNHDNYLVYSQIQESFRLEHILPGGLLENGEYYTAKVQVFDNQGNSSMESQAIAFYCFSTPLFQFGNLSLNQIVRNAVYNFQLEYAQSEGEELDLVQLILYDGSRRAVWSSDFKSNSVLSETVTGLENNTSYYIQGRGQTVHGMSLDTGLIAFSVSYIRPNAFAVVELDNQCASGCIRIASNIVSILGRSNNDNLTYLDGTWVDLTSDDWVIFDEGFGITGDYTLAVIGKSYAPYCEFLELKESADATNRLVLKYMVGQFKDYYVETAYIKHEYYFGDRLVYTTCSNLFDLSLNDEYIGFVTYLRRENGFYSLHVDAPAVNPNVIVHRFTQSQWPYWKGYEGTGYPEGFVVDNALTICTSNPL